MRLLVAFVLFASACTAPDPPGDAHAQHLIDEAIAAHGGTAYDETEIAFTFRGERYTARLNGGTFTYTRAFEDSTGAVVDVLDAGEVRRTVNGEAVPLGEAEQAAILTTVNSVPYFVLLPYRLRDAAVVATYAGPEVLDGEPYERVAVSFRQEGGGPDFEDQYLYWFHRDRHTMDYLAYTFSPDDTPYQSRFRVAFDPRTVGGIRFADYHNLAAPHAVLEGDLTRYGALYEAGRLDSISVIRTEDVAVSPRREP